MTSVGEELTRTPHAKTHISLVLSVATYVNISLPGYLCDSLDMTDSSVG